MRISPEAGPKFPFSFPAADARFRGWQSRFEHGVRIEGKAVDFLLDQKLGKLRIVARSLAADADFSPLFSAGGDYLGNGPLYGVVALIENGSDDFAIPIHAENKLGEIVRTDAESIEDFRELIG